MVEVFGIATRSFIKYVHPLYNHYHRGSYTKNGETCYTHLPPTYKDMGTFEVTLGTPSNDFFYPAITKCSTMSTSKTLTYKGGSLPGFIAGQYSTKFVVSGTHVSAKPGFTNFLVKECYIDYPNLC